jgi:lipid A ethanolaminephosphotransferase
VQERLRRKLPAAYLVGSTSLWMAGAGNAPLWRELQSLGLFAAPGGWLLAFTLAGAIAAALFALLSLFTWRPLLKPTIILLLFASAFGAYFMWTYRVVIDSTMATNTLQTDWREVLALMTPRLALVVLVGAVLPSWLVWKASIDHRPWKQQALRNVLGAGAGIVLIAALLLLSFQSLASTMRNHKELRYLINPLNSLYAVGHNAFGSQRLKGELLPVGRDAHLAAGGNAKPRMLVLVLGETARSDNLGLNGYPRNTTPELAQLQAISFRNAWSCGTSTAASVPCMFSPLGREEFLARRQDTETLPDVLQHAGLAVLWIDNQPGGCKGVCDRVPMVNTSALKDPALCANGECRDEILLKGLDERVAALPEEKRRKGVVLVMHQMGSHGPAYSERSPPAFKRFLPECTSSHLPDCSGEQLRNAYDNTIAYTDHVLAATVRWLQGRPDYDTALLYVSDHGESLGEKNLYLHGLPYALAPDVQKHVPWITWLSPGFSERSSVSPQCLRGRIDERITHDHLFHSVLGLMQVSTSAYRRALDAYAGCPAP